MFEPHTAQKERAWKQGLFFLVINCMVCSMQAIGNSFGNASGPRGAARPGTGRPRRSGSRSSGDRHSWSRGYASASGSRVAWLQSR